MESSEPGTNGEENASDLAHRLARYRRRVAAEGRPQSVRQIDRAIRDTSEERREP